MSDVGWLVLAPAAGAVVFAIILARFCKSCSRRRVVMVAALPVPALMAAVCAWIFLNAAFASKERCGVDACGMAMMFSTYGMGYAVAAFVVGIVAAGAVMRWKADR